MYYSWRSLWDISFLTGLSRFTVDKYLRRYVKSYKSEKEMTLKELLDKYPDRFDSIMIDYHQSPLDWFLHKYKTSIYFATEKFWFKKKSLRIK